jgi:AAA+ ATPase superfamily predicted ATPase
MITNRVGSPVRGVDFYGREAFVDLVWEKLKGGNVLLAAPRRFGKTSVMYRLIDEPRYDFKLVHADLEHLIEPADLIAHLVVQLAKDDRLSKIAGKLSYFPKTLWSRFRETFEEVDLLKLKVKLREKLRQRWQDEGEELFRRVADSQNTVVFILDEFPMMIDRMARSKTHREEAKTMLRWLRALRLSPNLKNIRFLIAGSIGIGQVLNELGEIAAINDFEQIRLDPFSPKIANALLAELAATQRLSLSKPSKRKMLELIGTPIPYFIQVIFSEVAKAYAQDNEPITPKRIERIYREKVLGVDCKTYFDHYYGRLRDYYQPYEEKAIKRMLRELAVVGSLTRDACYQFYREGVGNRADIEEFNRMMTDLENDFYVHFDADARRYEFASKLLRDWWLRHYGMEISI